MDQEWEGQVTADFSAAAERAEQVAARPAVWVECRCGHEWQSRARDRMTIRCPECGTGQRVPYRTYANTGPTPEGYRPPPAPSRPARVRPAPSWEPEPYDDDPDEWEPEPERVSLADALSGMFAALRRPAPVLPAPAAPRPARPARPAVASRPVSAPLAPRPTVQSVAQQVAPVQVDTLPLREQVRRDRMSQVLRSLSAHLMVWYDTPAGLCEALDTTLPRDRQRCPGTVTHGVTFFQDDGTDVTAYTCTAHAGPLAATALRSPYIRASPYRIR